MKSIKDLLYSKANGKISMMSRTFTQCGRHKMSFSTPVTAILYCMIKYLHHIHPVEINC